MPWPSVPLRSRLGQWAEQSVMVGGFYERGNPAVALLRIGSVGYTGRVRVSHHVPLKEAYGVAADPDLPSVLTISEAALSLTNIRPDRAALTPRTSMVRTLPQKRPTQILLSAWAATMLLAWITDLDAMYYLSGITTALLFAWAFVLRRQQKNEADPTVRVGRQKLSPARLYELLPIDTSTVDPHILSSASRVDLVWERYGALRDDIVYRIENSALFDAAVPQTQHFELALAGWDEMSPEAEVLATEIEEAFDEARRHAERPGLDHLPATARDDARRAAGAARLAVGAKTDGERAAAREQVIRILSSLALHYLPDPDQVSKQITAG